MNKNTVCQYKASKIERNTCLNKKKSLTFSSYRIKKPEMGKSNQDKPIIITITKNPFQDTKL